MDFATRYKKLNTAQQQAVDTVDGPVMVVAGPGTGKTELLSMRAANILRTTDALPETILCLTFTESGAAAMRKRLGEIIGKDAYKIAVHTFHSFGSDVINRHREHFYRGAEFRPADELASYDIATAIFAELKHHDPLAAEFDGDFTYLKSALASISDLKRAGLTASELRTILDHNQQTIDAVDACLAPIFAAGIKKTSTTEQLLAELPMLQTLETPLDMPGIVPLARLIADSLAAAIEEADGSTKPITAWRNHWMKKNGTGTFELKSRSQQLKLQALATIYERYAANMKHAKLYDFDDMIIEVVQAIERIPELRFELQETYQYIMVDEFQDTNLAQLRILRLLTDNPVNEDKPNILVVGDDDQAIYSFQGAEIGNIVGFQDMYPAAVRIPLVDNYRSTTQILTPARAVIVQADDRLETRFPDLNKTLRPHLEDTASVTEFVEYATIDDEYDGIAANIAAHIAQGVPPASIAVLARKHRELEQLLPHLAHHHINVNYERRDDVLELPIITHLELISQIITALAYGDHDHADSLLPQLLAHPAWRIAPDEVWRLSLAAKAGRTSWMEAMATRPALAQLHTWLLAVAQLSLTEPLERIVDYLLGVEPSEPTETDIAFVSPVYTYFFSEKRRETTPDDYLVCLEALRTIRSKLRDYRPDHELRLSHLLEFIALHRRLGSTITSLRPRAELVTGAIYLMTAHKSKGLEFDHVYICDAIDTVWGERVTNPPRLISYPENMPLAPSGGSLDERLRLFYVAMTRAKRQLSISYSLHGASHKDTLAASFLTEMGIEPRRQSATNTPEHAQAALELAWYQPLLELQPHATMRELLAPTLERYRLSATHVGSFLDVTRGGPKSFLLNQLLRFPSAKGAQASYGTAIHGTLQRVHQHLSATGRHLPLEDILHTYEELLHDQALPLREFDLYLEKGSATLQAFLAEQYISFHPEQKAELDFATDHVQIGAARLTGKLDVVDIDKAAQTVVVTDYKTGKSSPSWKGRTDAEKTKLHRYRQQLLFYKLLVEHSSRFIGYTMERGVLQFVEPNVSNAIVALDASFTDDEVADFAQLLEKIWQHITTLNLPDTSHYPATLAGIQAFERDLLDETI